MKLPTIGADPELFLETESGSLRSAIGRIGGDKANPRPLERPGFAVQEDNVAVEFNIPPTTDVAAFVESIQWSISRITDEVKSMGLRPLLKASAYFPNSELLNPRAHMFGCDPDYNAWSTPPKQNPRPMVESTAFRSCGGHVHVGMCGVPEEEEFFVSDFIKAMDLYLGVPSVAMDDDRERRFLYGKAGAHRLTSYGFEYRTLSNFWLQNPALTKWVFEQTQRAYKWVLSFYEQKNIQSMWDAIGEDIQSCINDADADKCSQLCTDYNLELVNVSR